MGDDDLFFALNSHYPLLLKIYLFLDSILSKVQNEAVQAVSSMVTVSLTQNQFDALV